MYTNYTLLSVILRHGLGVILGLHLLPHPQPGAAGPVVHRQFGLAGLHGAAAHHPDGRQHIAVEILLHLAFEIAAPQPLRMKFFTKRSSSE